MIELKNISKNYKSKKRVKTKALDNVSLQFDDKGITFILGKSGSGKSTLLNILGGLDKYDGGEMIILGKSSKDFTQADFDSYRNTYIGFIFQEFNILEDYDVYENVSLALELQQKTVDDKKIDDLLEKLELKSLKYRKINELSGGQKQRVAIARALIKNPKIILADEPTGNLDSQTGSQVMDLLKEISKEKLVIIVSHDEEFAHKYGNRIIEIKDGQVINDTNEVKNKKSENTYEIVKSHLPLKRGFKLGIGSLKHKKMKLFFTILLTVITLGFLSCTDTLTGYNADREHSKKLASENEEFIQIESYKTVDRGDFGYSVLLSLDDNKLNEIKGINGEGYEVYSFYEEELPNRILHINYEVNSYTSSDSAELVVTDDVSKILKENITGKSILRENEIIISNKIADLIIEKGIEVHENVTQNEFQVSKIFEPKSYEEILNTNYTYYFGSLGKIKISGIINYDDVSYSKGNIINKIYVSKDFFDNVQVGEVNGLKSYYEPNLSIENIKPYSEYIYSTPAVLDKEIEYFDGNSWKKTSSLKENEVILNLYQVVDSSEYSNALSAYINKAENYGNYDYNASSKKFFEYYVNNLNVIGNKASLKIYYESDGDENNLAKEYNDLVVIGIYHNYNYDYINYFSKDILEEYQKNAFERVSILYPMTKRKDFQKVFNKFSDSSFSVKTTYNNAFENEASYFATFKKISLVIGLVFLLFTILLIGNFIVTSINYRKKEIGILRALGARSMDVTKIFLWEGIILSIISGTVASILLVVVTNFINEYIMTRMSILSTPFCVTFRQFAVIYILVFMVTIISSILPIMRISKMKPVDAILNK